MRTRLFLFLVLLVCQSSWGQKPEYDFYPEFSNVVAPKFYLVNPASSLKDVVAGYVAASESARDRFEINCASGADTNVVDRHPMDSKSCFRFGVADSRSLAFTVCAPPGPA